MQAADDTATQKTDQQYEDQPEQQLPGRAEMKRRLEEVAQVQPYRGAYQGSEQSTGAPDRRLHDELPRGFERESVWRHEGLQDAQQPTGESSVGGGNNEGGELVAVNVVADGGGT